MFEGQKQVCSTNSGIKHALGQPLNPFICPVQHQAPPLLHRAVATRAAMHTGRMLLWPSLACSPNRPCASRAMQWALDVTPTHPSLLARRSAGRDTAADPAVVHTDAPCCCAVEAAHWLVDTARTLVSTSKPIAAEATGAAGCACSAKAARFMAWVVRRASHAASQGKSLHTYNSPSNFLLACPISPQANGLKRCIKLYMAERYSILCKTSRIGHNIDNFRSTGPLFVGQSQHDGAGLGHATLLSIGPGGARNVDVALAAVQRVQQCLYVARG